MLINLTLLKLMTFCIILKQKGNLATVVCVDFPIVLDLFTLPMNIVYYYFSPVWVDYHKTQLRFCEAKILN